MKRVNFLCLAILGLFFTACHSNDDKWGDWSRSYSFPGLGRTGAVSFVMKDAQGKEFAYVGLGINSSKVNDRDYTLRDFYRFNGRNWVQVDSFPAEAKGRYGAVAFVIDQKAYVGTGCWDGITSSDEDIFFNDFWVFDPNQPSGSQWSKGSIPNLPGVGRREAIAFSLNGKGYVGTGLADGVQALQDFYCYDPSENSWLKTGFNGDPRFGAVAFVMSGKAVVCLGASGNSTYLYDVNIFDPAVSDYDSQWKTSPNSLRDQGGRSWDNDYGRIPRVNAVAFTSTLDRGRDRGYIATGQGPYRNTCWEYNIQDDRWEEVSELSNLMTQRSYAVGFTLNNYGYVTTGGSTKGSVVDTFTWKFTPGIDEDDDNDYAPQD